MQGVSLPHPADIPQDTLERLTDTIEALEHGRDGNVLSELLLARIALDRLPEDHTLDDFTESLTMVGAGLMLERLRRNGLVRVVGDYLPWDGATQWVRT